MDERLFQAIVSSDLSSFMDLVRENSVSVLEQRIPESLNTPLHLASKLGNTQLVEEILKLCPDMVSMRNSKLNTAFHEACYGGHVSVLRLLLMVHKQEIFLLNGEGESPLYIACKNGHSEAVQLLLTLPGILEVKGEVSDKSPVHVAALRGHTGDNTLVLDCVGAHIFHILFLTLLFVYEMNGIVYIFVAEENHR